ncbi:MAG: PilN domain-containing protein [Actinomycetota bacterium]
MRINLLPPELRERERGRRGAVAVILIGLLVIGGLGGYFVLQERRLGDIERDLDAQQATNNALRAEIAEIARFGELKQQLEGRQGLVDAFLVNEVQWSGVLRDVSLIIPGDAWLVGVSGTVMDPIASPGVDVSGLIGQIAFNGFGLSHRSVALWLTRLEDISGFLNPWLSSSTKTLVGPTEVVQFTSSVDLSAEVATRSAQ